MTAAARPSGACLAPGRPEALPTEGTLYTRLFPDLPSPGHDAGGLTALGGKGGRCDGSASPAESRTEAGWPFFGQFIAHDITADRSPLERSDHPVIANQRRPRLNLESVYGGGPSGTPYLYDPADSSLFLLAESGADVQRTWRGTAIIGDARNDSHFFMNRLHLAFQRAHNAIARQLAAEGMDETERFEQARNQITWSYQWVVMHEYLPKLVGQAVLNALRDGSLALPLAPGLNLPYEFADAAFRYGHSQIRQSYRINATSGALDLFPDLLGFRPVAAERDIDWSLMFDTPGKPPAQRAMRINETLPFTLIKLPEAITGGMSDEAYHSLANRDLRRGMVTELPCGESVAHALGLPVLSPQDVGATTWPGQTPLWFYILREADVMADGDALGPVGGAIVAGVLQALIDRDPESFLNAAPDWAPPGSSAQQPFGLVDLLARGQTEKTA